MKSFNEIHIKLQAYFETLGLMRLSQSLLSKVSDGTVNWYFPKLKTQQFTWSWWKQSSSTMSPATLSIAETSFQARIYTEWNTLQYSNNFAWLRITGKSYSNYYSDELQLRWEQSWNTTAWKTITKSDTSTTVYMIIGSLQGSLTANWPVYLQYYERTTQAISKNPWKKCIPKTVWNLWSLVTSYLFGRLADWTWRDGN